MAVGSGILYCCRLSYKPVPGVLGVEGGGGGKRRWRREKREREREVRGRKGK